MSERINVRHEQSGESKVEHQKAAEKHEAHVEGPTKHEHQQNMAEILAKVHTEAKPGHHVNHPTESVSLKEPQYVSRELKAMAYDRTIRRVRKHLSLPGRVTSKFIHQPIVNAVSEVTGKTVGRPSGLLGGGLVAFIGTSIYYFITRHYDYEYNPTVFLVLLGAGFIVGWILEIFIKTTRKAK